MDTKTIVLGGLLAAGSYFVASGDATKVKNYLNEKYFNRQVESCLHGEAWATAGLPKEMTRDTIYLSDIPKPETPPAFPKVIADSLDNIAKRMHLPLSKEPIGMSIAALDTKNSCKDTLSYIDTRNGKKLLDVTIQGDTVSVLDSTGKIVKRFIR